MARYSTPRLFTLQTQKVKYCMVIHVGVHDKTIKSQGCHDNRQNENNIYFGRARQVCVNVDMLFRI